MVIQEYKQYYKFWIAKHHLIRIILLLVNMKKKSCIMWLSDGHIFCENSFCKLILMI